MRSMHVRLQNDVESVDEFGHCYATCSYAAECEECGIMTQGWEYDTGLDDFGRCVDCSVDCEICNEAVRTIDELDDFNRCESCAKLMKEERSVSVKVGSRTITAAVTLGDTVLSVKERIKEARGPMTRQAEHMELFYQGSRLIDDCILGETSIMWQNGPANIASVIELTFESVQKKSTAETCSHSIYRRLPLQADTEPPRNLERINDRIINNPRNEGE